MHGKGSETPIGFMGSKSDKRNHKLIFRMMQLCKKTYNNWNIAYPYWGYKTNQIVLIYQLQVHSTMTGYIKYKIL